MIFSKFTQSWDRCYHPFQNKSISLGKVPRAQFQTVPNTAVTHNRPCPAGQLLSYFLSLDLPFLGISCQQNLIICGHLDLLSLSMLLKFIHAVASVRSQFIFFFNGCQGGRMGERDSSGVWDGHVHSAVFKTDD